MTTDDRNSSSFSATIESAKRSLLDHAFRDCEEDCGFDRMEVARALAAVALKRVDALEPPEYVADYLRHVQQVCEGRVAQRKKIIRHVALQESARKQGGLE